MGGKRPKKRSPKWKRLFAKLMLTTVLTTTVLGQGGVTSLAAEDQTATEYAADMDVSVDDVTNEQNEQELDEVNEITQENPEAQTDENTSEEEEQAEENKSDELPEETSEETATEEADYSDVEEDNATTDITDIEYPETEVIEEADEADAGLEVMALEEAEEADGAADDTVKILMVGNSLTRYNDVAGKLQTLFALDGIDAQVDTRTQMGASLFDQADILKESTRAAIVDGDYDYVVLQEKSSGFSEALLRQGAEAFYPWIEEAPSQPQLVFYMPWANEDVLKSMQTTVTNAYVSVAKDFNAKLAPAGEAYYELYFDKNKKWYRKGDNVHGNDLASLISASTIYYTMTGKDSAFSFTSEDKDALTALVESADYKNNRVSYNADTVNLIEETALKYTGIYSDLNNVPDLEGRGMDGNTNLAKGKQGSASSNGRGSTRGIGARNVGNLTDGSYTSFLVSHEEDPDIWYRVDFEKSTKIDEVILYFGGTGTYVNTENAVFTVEMSDSPDSDYFVVASGESTSTEPMDFKFDEAQGRYLRVHVSSFSGPYVSMFEIEAYYQKPETTEDENGNDDPAETGNENENGEDEGQGSGNQEEPSEEDEFDGIVKAFPGDFLQVRVGENTANMALYDGNMYEAVLPFSAGENTVSILVNGKVVKEKVCNASKASQDVTVRYFADNDKVVTGFDTHKDGNGNVVQDIKKIANWTGNFFNRAGINEFKEFGGWDQANVLSRLDYIGGGVFKRTFTYTVPESSISYEFKINFDGVWSNGEVPSSNATVTFPASEKETDTFVLFVNSTTGEWFDSINSGKIAYKLADGSVYEQEAGKAKVEIALGGETKEMVQTSKTGYRLTDYLTAGTYNVSIYADGQLVEDTELTLKGSSSVTAVYDTKKGLEIIKNDSIPEETGNDDTNENSGNTGSEAGNKSENTSSETSEKVTTDNETPKTTTEEAPAETVDKKQKKSSVSKLSAGKKTLTVKWKKVTAKGIKGYEIQYSTDKSFEKNVKTVTINKTKTTTKTFKKLKSKKKYYVRIRTYSKKNGEKVYSNWSKVKSIKVK
ncbi:discoidin domain-containing protein [Butyrivibrio sp. AE3006]|uniref:discoidin domain-containing protein n=1 Tax=Butyrivibrio sp. AE3006 TaxID=1280673 RepID=UPI0018CBD972|nr:discoidin domain-containing protein [Butyrivibrio sp. AE3006]